MIIYMITNQIKSISTLQIYNFIAIQFVSIRLKVFLEEFEKRIKG